MIDRDFQLSGKPDCERSELVREAACSLIDALTLYAAKMNIDLKRDLEIPIECEQQSKAESAAC